MDNRRTIIFNSTALGASHIKDSKPCQDYSLSWRSDNGDTLVIIVCDGHGSSTYVRSDVGSRLAAEAALDAIKSFVQGDPEWLNNTSGAVTARESDEALRFNTEPPAPDATDVEKERYEQRLMFIDQVDGIRDQDKVFEALFTSIYEDWLSRIASDKEQNPFTEDELKLLNGNRIEKAYGSTLMAYVQTPNYWFAFHIGDGRLIGLNNNYQWAELVPWDCNCFLNSTTSLCNSNPVPKFRYAFDATGHFPIAVFCCSDGVEDSYGDYTIDPERLHTFYSGLLNSFFSQGFDSTKKKIDDFLPKLSEKGSKDDMSLAGIIDLTAARGFVINRLQEQRKDIENQIADLQKEKEQIDNRLSDVVRDDTEDTLDVEELPAATQEPEPKSAPDTTSSCDKRKGIFQRIKEKFS